MKNGTEASDTVRLNEAMKDAVRARHSATKWELFIELRASSGNGGGREQRFDAFAINTYPSEGLERHAYEIKVSRSDFLRELKHPEKRAPALRFSNYFWFVAPPGVADRSEIPDECGLIEVGGANPDPGNPLTAADRRKVVVKAPHRESMPPTWGFLCSMARRSTDNEKACGWRRQTVKVLEAVCDLWYSTKKPGGLGSQPRHRSLRKLLSAYETLERLRFNLGVPNLEYREDFR